MKRRIQYEIETDKTGEFCSPKCPYLNHMTGKCRITNRHIKFRSEILEKTREIKQLSGLSVRDISKRMGMGGSPSQVERIIDEKRPANITLKTLFRFAEACGYVCNISFKKKGEEISARSVIHCHECKHWYGSQYKHPERIKKEMSCGIKADLIREAASYPVRYGMSDKTFGHSACVLAEKRERSKTCPTK